MKTLLLTLTYLVGAGELILAIYFWATNLNKWHLYKPQLWSFFNKSLAWDNDLYNQKNDLCTRFLT